MESFGNSYAPESYSSTDHQYPYYQYQQEFRSAAVKPPSYRAALHTVRRFPSKYQNHHHHVITKKPIAPLPPTPPKIYKVDPVNFKDVVQKLTGPVELVQPTRLQEVAPPPLDLVSPWPLHRNFSFAGSNEEEKQRKVAYENGVFGALSPLGFNLSPASIAWCSSVLMSPDTVASLDISAVV